MEAIYKAEEGDLRLEIFTDMDPDNPRKDMDWLGRMLCWHGRYDLGDEQPDISPMGKKIEIAQEVAGLPDWEEYLEDHIDEAEAEDALVGVYANLVENALDTHVARLPLYLYDHSGITMSTGPFSCPWDSGQVGFIYMTYERFFDETSAKGALHLIQAMRKINGRKIRATAESDAALLEKLETAYEKREVTPEVIRGAEAYLESEVEEYDKYLTGDVYGYVLSKVVTCDHGDEHTEELNSCWMFYGDDFKTNGLLDNLGSEYEGLVDKLELHV